MQLAAHVGYTPLEVRRLAAAQVAATDAPFAGNLESRALAVCRPSLRERSAPPTRLCPAANSVSVTSAPRWLDRPMLSWLRAMKKSWRSPRNGLPSPSRGRPGASSPAASTPKPNRPAVPVVLAPQSGSTMRRVWTAVRITASPPAPASSKLPIPSMKKGRFSEKKRG